MVEAPGAGRSQTSIQIKRERQQRRGLGFRHTDRRSAIRSCTTSWRCTSCPQRHLARRQNQVLAAALQREVTVEPDARLQALYPDIRIGSCTTLIRVMSRE